MRESVTRFVDTRVEQDSFCWHSNDTIWAAYVDFCRDESLPTVGGKAALSRFLNEDIDFELIDSHRSVDGQAVRGKTGMRIQGASGKRYNQDTVSWESFDPSEENP